MIKRSLTDCLKDLQVWYSTLKPYESKDVPLDELKNGLTRPILDKDALVFFKGSHLPKFLQSLIEEIDDVFSIQGDLKNKAYTVTLIPPNSQMKTYTIKMPTNQTLSRVVANFGSKEQYEIETVNQKVNGADNIVLFENEAFSLSMLICTNLSISFTNKKDFPLESRDGFRNLTVKKMVEQRWCIVVDFLVTKELMKKEMDKSGQKQKGFVNEIKPALDDMGISMSSVLP